MSSQDHHIIIKPYLITIYPKSWLVALQEKTERFILWGTWQSDPSYSCWIINLLPAHVTDPFSHWEVKVSLDKEIQDNKSGPTEEIQQPEVQLPEEKRRGKEPEGHQVPAATGGPEQGEAAGESEGLWCSTSRALSNWCNDP